LTPGRGALLIPLLQLFSGIGVIGDAVFIYSPLHLVCDLIAFNSALLFLFASAWRFSRETRWKGWTAYSILTAVLMMALLAAFGVANQLGGPAGLLEKLAASTRTLWSALLAARLLNGAHFDPESRLGTR
jgi:cellobiose-specific phosphotransferase system component IIC